MTGNILQRGDVVNGTYTVKMPVGRGAFGEVYLVEHRFLGSQAMKVMPPPHAGVEKALNEAKILASLSDPHIVRVFEANTLVQDGREYCYIVMEFVPGESLEQLLSRKGPLPADLAMRLQKEVLTGLAVLHGRPQPVTHGDVKPGNILLHYVDGEPSAKISDFGLAAQGWRDGLTAGGGTLAYLSPEGFEGIALPAGDVFSAAVVMVRMLTGKFPWPYVFDGPARERGAWREMVTAARAAGLQLDPSLAPPLRAVLEKALAWNWQDRYADAGEFLAALDLARTGAQVRDGRKSELTAEATPATVPRTVQKSAGPTGFAAIAGMAGLKQLLQDDVVLPLRDKARYAEYKVGILHGLLLFGPPGCGKTYVARRLAEELGFTFFELKPSDFASTYVHGTQEKIGKLFAEARAQAPSILFVDELDAMLPKRDAILLSHHYAAEVNEFLAQLSDPANAEVLFLGATNVPERLDTAILRTGRIDKVVYIPPPDDTARAELFAFHLAGRPGARDIDCARLARATAGYAASDISFIVDDAARGAARARRPLGDDALAAGCAARRSSVTIEQLARYRVFEQEYGRR